MKLRFILVLFLVCYNCERKQGEKVILGSHLGFINTKYYAIDSISLELNSEFTAKMANQDLDYPHAFRYLLDKDRGKYPFGKGFVFVDSKTTEIKIDTLFQFCPKFEYEDLNEEYRYKFLPFVYNKQINDCSNIIESLFFNREEDDQLLLEYITQNPSSYVALWHLIERVDDLGYTGTRDLAVNAFSKEMKGSTIWKTLEDDLLKLKPYSKGQILPTIVLKDTVLNELRLSFDKLTNKYTLIEFWFSRCKPCHKNFERLIPLYGTYNRKGFDIINISTDTDEEIELWKEQLERYDFPWPNYLDLNKVEAKKMNISSYPHSFLLDEKGQIVMVDPSFNELKVFLEQNL